ncbi:hypothetical protein LR48_Vigan07g107000 [Vigna angularis]|uniref:Putative plant transposon protein domain-containing protein n=1 Tax=Phaseolus angularis TaxID=3914 RepID=A0A0L9UXA6_PHAAN|nr:hypothetical protein LR48_Vigan07g107000 [Vigna angularis]
MTSSSGRRIQTASNKRKEKEQYYSHQYRTAATRVRKGGQHQRLGELGYLSFSHISDITTQRAILLYCILSGREVNLGAVIAEEIKICARAMSSRTPLGHPSLITHLCEIMGVDVSMPPLEQPRKELDGPISLTTALQRSRPQLGHHSRLPRGEHELLRTFTFAFPEREFISEEEFAARVAYPEGLAQAAGGDAVDEEEDSND